MLVISIIGLTYSIWYQRTKPRRALQQAIKEKNLNLDKMYEQTLEKLEQATDEKTKRECIEELKFIANAKAIIHNKKIKRQ